MEKEEGKTPKTARKSGMRLCLEWSGDEEGKQQQHRDTKC